MWTHTVGPVRTQAPVLRFEIGRLGIGQGKSVFNMHRPFPPSLKPELLHAIPAHSSGGPTPSSSLTPGIALSRMAEDRKQEVLCTRLGPGK